MAGERFRAGLHRVSGAVNSVVSGSFLGRWSKCMGHVIVVAVCFLVLMVSGCIVEGLRIKLKGVKNELEETRLIYTQKNLELVGLGRMSTVEHMLVENGSRVGRPEKPAVMIEK